MLDSSIIVQSAISSFNNAAILAPTFLWSAVLMLPLFAMVWIYGNDFVCRFPKLNMGLVTDFVLIFWLVIMHGNYAVLRDGASIISYVVAAILFILTVSATQKLREINPPMPKILQKKSARYLIYAAAVALVGMSGEPTLFGFILQAAAVVCGIIVGARSRININPMWILFAIITAILMQPEFFRFGMLGNLTVIHLTAMVFAGTLIAMIAALRNARPRGKIRHSAFVKLKWMMRIIIGLALVLFALTESVPVFLGLCAVMFVQFAISVWHAKSVSNKLTDTLFAILVCVFGVMTTLPLITAIGILYYQNTNGNIRDAKFLL